MKYLLFVGCLLFFVGSAAQDEAKKKSSPAIENTKALFNGKDLKGWYTFLSTKGKNNDPEKIFVVEDSMIHISGKEFGYIATEKIYTNFHLIAEFKWGVKKYPPRDSAGVKRDNGICFYFPVSERDTVWPKSIECQIQEGDVGDLWLIDSTTVKIKGARTEPNDYTRVYKKADAENPTGEWNRIEIIANRGMVTYIVNGKIVNEFEDPSLEKGKILVQSEGAEIYYRKIELAEYR